MAKKRILMIDDEEDLCLAVKLNLEKTGRFEVITTTNGTRGVQLAKTFKPDLILLDIIMPEMGGAEVSEILLESPDTGIIPILFLSAIVTKEEVREKKGVIGGRFYIAKPATPEELIGRIDSILA